MTAGLELLAMAAVLLFAVLALGGLPHEPNATRALQDALDGGGDDVVVRLLLKKKKLGFAVRSHSEMIYLATASKNV